MLSLLACSQDGGVNNHFLVGPVLYSSERQFSYWGHHVDVTCRPRSAPPNSIAFEIISTNKRSGIGSPPAWVSSWIVVCRPPRLCCVRRVYWRLLYGHTGSMTRKSTENLGWTCSWSLACHESGIHSLAMQSHIHVGRDHRSQHVLFQLHHRMQAEMKSCYSRWPWSLVVFISRTPGSGIAAFIQRIA